MDAATARTGEGGMTVYTWKNGNYVHMGVNIQKSIKIDQETLEIIEACAGRSFSDKVRNMAKEFKRQQEEKR